MLKRVEPLRNELQALEDQAQTNVTAGNEVSELISQLEKSIASYKEEYAQLISQAQAIKTDLGTVQAKVSFSLCFCTEFIYLRTIASKILARDTMYSLVPWTNDEANAY